MQPLDRPIITPELIERFATYRQEQPAWGVLHIVLDDDNLENHAVEFCIGYAEEQGDIEGRALGEILVTMSKSQRHRIGRRAEAFLKEKEEGERESST